MAEKKYITLYQHFKEQILTGSLKAGTKMPSIRRCCEDLPYSRTTVEAAYLMLAAEGYLIAKPQSGYYVTEIAQANKDRVSHPEERHSIRYDFTASGSVMDEASYELWKRYVKSALRKRERLLTYGDPQGEEDLREELSEYLKEKRGILCSPEDIVIGAGIQSLLNLLCPLLSASSDVSFPSERFLQSIAIFENFGKEIHIKDKDASIIYVAPAHMTRWGTIMPIGRRLELIQHAASNQSLIIEDDYENEFVDYQKPTPALYSLAGGNNIVYISSFSRSLLPSFRLSFMILPPKLKQAYLKQKHLYNQTASKMEQIALCQYIRDGHLNARIRKLKRIYVSRMAVLESAVRSSLSDLGCIRTGEGGFTMAIQFQTLLSAEHILKAFEKDGIRIQLYKKDALCTLLLSCTQLDEPQISEGIRHLGTLLRQLMDQP